MGTTSYGGKGSKGMAANGDQPVGAASCRREEHTMASCHPPPPPVHVMAPFFFCFQRRVGSKRKYPLRMDSLLTQSVAFTLLWLRNPQLFPAPPGLPDLSVGHDTLPGQGANTRSCTP